MLFTRKLRHREAKQHAWATWLWNSIAAIQPEHSSGLQIPHSQLCCKVSASPGPSPSVKLPWESSLLLLGQFGLTPLCSLVGPHAHLCPHVSLQLAVGLSPLPTRKETSRAEMCPGVFVGLSVCGWSVSIFLFFQGQHAYSSYVLQAPHMGPILNPFLKILHLCVFYLLFLWMVWLQKS